MKELIIIYDFDGTLTPYSYPQYEILNECGYSEYYMKELVSNFVEKGNDIYLSYMLSIYDIFDRFNIPRDMNMFYKSATKVKYNNGVLEYFEKFTSPNIKHYVVTSGFKDFVEHTKVAKYLKDVYGTTVTSDYNFQHKDIMTDVKKVNAIKDIVKSNNNDFRNVIYFGDGLTDRYAFDYVHRNGGTAILVINKLNDNIYDLLKKENIIDFCFDSDYSKNSDIDKYISSRL